MVKTYEVTDNVILFVAHAHLLIVNLLTKCKKKLLRIVKWNCALSDKLYTTSDYPLSVRKIKQE